MFFLIHLPLVMEILVMTLKAQLTPFCPYTVMYFWHLQLFINHSKISTVCGWAYIKFPCLVISIHSYFHTVYSLLEFSESPSAHMQPTQLKLQSVSLQFSKTIALSLDSTSLCSYLESTNRHKQMVSIHFLWLKYTFPPQLCSHC